MQPDDLNAVLKIIDDFDDDDGEASKSFFEESGVDDHFVLELDGAVAGVTGYTHVPATDRTSFLSWTYLAPAHRGAGHGRAMLTELLDQLRQLGCRKVFVKVSNYVCPDDGEIYLSALKLYQSLGFKLELTGVDFYDEGENQLILGLPLQEEDAEQTQEIKSESPALQFRTVYEIADSDGAYSFEWFAESKLSLFSTKNFTGEDLATGLDAVKSVGGRKVFLTFPSNLPIIEAPLQEAGFELSGRLSDYYEKGLDELHFTHNLS